MMHGMGNIQGMMEQVQKMQKEMAKAQGLLNKTELIDRVTNESVRAAFTGDRHIKGTQINEEVVDPDDIEILQDLVVVAVNDAIAQIDVETEKKLGKYAKDLLGSQFQTEGVMNMQYPELITRLIGSYVKLPGIGQKVATRLAFYTIGIKDEVMNEFVKSLLNIKRDLHFCSACGNITEGDPCEVCRNPSYDRSITLVVEGPKDVMAMEKTRKYHGLYHVFHGVLSPMEGTGPEDISISPLSQRLHDADVEEVIIATNAIAEGEATAMHLSRLIKSAGIKVTHLAHGLSVGFDIEYANGVVLLKVVEGRREL